MSAEHVCRGCGNPLTAENCYLPGIERGIYVCRRCDNNARNARRAANPEKSRKYRRQWKTTNKVKVQAADKRYRQKNRERIRETAAEYAKSENGRLVAAAWRAVLKFEVLSHYSGCSPPQCKCGYNDIRALTIDHVDGGGAQHRRELNGGGSRMYQWLKQNNFPLGFQVLCGCCQMIKRVENKEFGTRETG